MCINTTFETPAVMIDIAKLHTDFDIFMMLITFISYIQYITQQLHSIKYNKILLNFIEYNKIQ
jgi:hypothetical protein